jgi:hypothetical protein
MEPSFKESALPYLVTAFFALLTIGFLTSLALAAGVPLDIDLHFPPVEEARSPRGRELMSTRQDK